MSQSTARAAISTDADLPTVVRSSRDRTFDRIRWVLIAGWTVVLVLLPVTAERTSSWSHLKSLVASGAVSSVEIDGEMPAATNGFATVVLRWHRHGLDYVARVAQVRGEDAQGDCAEDDDCFDASETTLHSPPSSRLQELQPGLSLTRHEHGQYNDDGLLGFAVPLYLAIVEAVFGLAALVMLIAGPQTWRATKWAWFWWFPHPVGMAALLLLSGPVPGLPAPRNPERRLTGGWSLLLSIVVSAVTLELWGFTLH